MKRFSTLYRKRAFIDSNILIYFLTGMSRSAKDLFSPGETEKIDLVTSLRVIDETIFKITLIKACELFEFTSIVPIM